MNTAIITGITGQDGSYLAEHLLTKGWRIFGAVRDRSIACLTPSLAEAVELLDWDMHDMPAMAAMLALHRPTAVYNLAACSSGARMFDNPIGIGEVNGIAVARLLEAIRMASSDTKLCQASSSEMFGDTGEGLQSETTPFRPRSPYGAAKLYAHSMVDIYRRHHGLFACSAILYNHESPRRGAGFVTSKIARGAARIRLGLANELRLGSLEARRDWGYAPDYVQAMHLMLEQPQADDYVVATGETHSVREFCDVAFRRVGLDYREYVREDITAYRKAQEVPLCGDAGKAVHVLGWRPRTGFHELVNMMVDAELKSHTATGETMPGRERDAR